MINLIDNLFPWFGDMVELGGNILLVIIALAMLIWTFVLERAGYLVWSWPRQRDRAIALWDELLAIEPDHENARLYRSQALELQQKLRSLM